MELQIPHRVCAEISAQTVLQRKSKRDWRDFETAQRMEGVKIVEAEMCPAHIHMLVEIPPKMSVAGYIGFLIGKSSLMIFQRHGNLKYKYGNRSFWCRGYYVDTAGKNMKKIAEYIQNQLKEDQLTDQMTLKEYIDPLAGSK